MDLSSHHHASSHCHLQAIRETDLKHMMVAQHYLQLIKLFFVGHMIAPYTASVLLMDLYYGASKPQAKCIPVLLFLMVLPGA